MRSSLVALVLLAVAFTVVSKPAPATAPARLSSFSMVITSSATGWTAHCDSGCQWTELALRCSAACGVLVDEFGLTPLTATPAKMSAFAFELTPTDSGPRAIARYGMTWQSVSWRCGRAPCRARLDASGVGAVESSRP